MLIHSFYFSWPYYENDHPASLADDSRCEVVARRHREKSHVQLGTHLNSIFVFVDNVECATGLFLTRMLAMKGGGFNSLLTIILHPV